MLQELQNYPINPASDFFAGLSTDSLAESDLFSANSLFVAVSDSAAENYPNDINAQQIVRSLVLETAVQTLAPDQQVKWMNYVNENLVDVQLLNYAIAHIPDSATETPVELVTSALQMLLYGADIMGVAEWLQTGGVRGQTPNLPRSDIPEMQQLADINMPAKIIAEKKNITDMYILDFDGTILTRPADITKAGFAAKLDTAEIRDAATRTAVIALNMLQKKGASINIVTGNILQNVLAKINAAGLKPNNISTKVGTELWQLEADGKYRQSQNHKDSMQQNFDNDRIFSIVQKVFAQKGIYVERHQAIMGGPGKESVHVAFPDYITAENYQSLIQVIDTQVQQALQAESMNAKTNYSLITEDHERQHFANLGFAVVLNYDVLHNAADKDSAATSLQQQYNVNQIYVAGDGGNDLPLYNIPGVQAILPANAAADLQQAVAGRDNILPTTLPAGLGLVQQFLSMGKLTYNDLQQNDALNGLPEEFIRKLRDTAAASNRNKSDANFAADDTSSLQLWTDPPTMEITAESLLPPGWQDYQSAANQLASSPKILRESASLPSYGQQGGISYAPELPGYAESERIFGKDVARGIQRGPVAESIPGYQDWPNTFPTAGSLDFNPNNINTPANAELAETFQHTGNTEDKTAQNELFKPNLPPFPLGREGDVGDNPQRQVLPELRHLDDVAAAINTLLQDISKAGSNQQALTQLQANLAFIEKSMRKNETYILSNFGHLETAAKLVYAAVLQQLQHAQAWANEPQRAQDINNLQQGALTILGSLAALAAATLDPRNWWRLMSGQMM